MAAAHRYTWGALDDIWSVCARYLAASGWADTPSFVQIVQAANNVDQPHPPGADPATWQAIYDWGAVKSGRTIVLPYAT